MERVCVFCGSNPGNSPEYAEAARQLGTTLAERGLGVVYGGSSVGLMGRVADAALAAGGEVVGVIPEKLRAKEIFHKGLTKLHVVDSMHERKALMAKLSDAFIALPGGIGTFEEFFEVLTWNQLGYHAKPCGLLNVNGYYEQLTAFLDNVVQQGFLVQEHRNMVLASHSPAELLDQFLTYTPPQVEKWIEKKKGL
ncbi:TIGR00730 family Rossman fold protein [Pseudodesulfovibrio senegalensis]|uniref:Cytokinin riboside 5'-monophosphate phosphoribohydrolase n=1 Tax=Pseudodesulfovibrio senegalensis TaxID=1721087 RepID=A0A6N6N4L1_9BACT|nr:TIGR00730 family Rossman fold protein [Pseudodesulfovibrio senegalensis]KAB1442450.1 TIGR00730 family Rossman fold protein [Pseudodesulfovibrio senegalensis]